MRLSLEPRRDERLLTYALAVSVSLILALLTARVELAAVGAGFALAIVGGRRRRYPIVDVEASVHGDRFVEGDVVRGHVAVAFEPAIDSTASVEVMIEPSADLSAVARSTLAWESTGPLRGEFTILAQRWGRYLVGPTSVRVRDPHSFVCWEGTLTDGPRLVVLPTALRLDRILEPRSSRAVAGSHLARRALGSGVDFAELHWYQPGDRLRDLNIAATGRSRRPIVNRHHPERSGDVIILLDTFIDSSVVLSTSARRALVLEARAAWALARSHLAANDRVGVATLGRLPVWLDPTAGARARYAIFDALLAVGDVLEGGAARAEWLEISKVPPAALVVLISPLWSNRYTRQLARLRARGRETAVIQLSTAALLGPPRTAQELLARRVFAMLTDDRAADLRRAGVNVVEWDTSGSLGATVAVAARSQLRRRTARMS